MMKKSVISVDKAKEIREVKGIKETKLQKLRVERGFSQHSLSVASKVPKRMIQAYEQQSRYIDKSNLKTICSLCVVLNCKIEDVLEDDELIEIYKIVK